MMSCTFPTQTVTSDAWSIQGECEMVATPPCYHDNGSKDSNDDQILDFKRLESDIIKNVLCEDNCEDEEMFCGAVFPSFNYAPVPNPPTLARLKLTKPYTSGLLVLDQKIADSLEIRSTSKQQRSSSSPCLTGTQTVGIKVNERRKLNHKKSYSKIFDTCSTRERLGVANVKQNGKKSLKNQAFKNNAQLTATARSTKSPAIITIARRQWNHNPTNRPRSPSSHLDEPMKNNLFAIKLQEADKTNAEVSRSDFYSDDSKSNSTEALTLSSVFEPAANQEQKETSVTVGRSGTQRRNLTLRQSTRSDQKKRKIGEKTAKTFAQIVAASPAVTPKSNQRFYKF